MAKPGDPILDVYTAAWYNKVDKAVNKKLTGVPAIRNNFQQSWIWVSNHEAVAKDQFTVVAIGDPSLLISDRLDNITNDTIWETQDLDSDEPDNIFILLDPLPGEIGAQARALVCGVGIIKLWPTSSRDSGKFLRYYPSAFDALDLVGASSGRIQIVAKVAEEITDETYEYHLIIAGAIFKSAGSARFVLTSDLTGGSSGPTGDYAAASANFYDDSLNLLGEFSLQLNYDMFSDLVEGDFGEAVMNERGYWIAVNAPCVISS